MIEGLYKGLRQVLDALFAADKEAIFHRPVDVESVKDYLEVIQHPMDFSTIQSNLEGQCYPPDDLHTFQRHLELTFQNAILFNRPRSVYATEARRLRGLLPGLLRRHLSPQQRIELARQACQHLWRTLPAQSAALALSTATVICPPLVKAVPLETFQAHLHIVVWWVLLTHEHQRLKADKPVKVPPVSVDLSPQSFFDVFARLQARMYNPPCSSATALSESLLQLKGDLVAAIQALSPTRGLSSTGRRTHAAHMQACTHLVRAAVGLLAEHWELPEARQLQREFSRMQSLEAEGVDAPPEVEAVDGQVAAESAWGGSSTAQQAAFTFADRMDHVLSNKTLLQRHSHVLADLYVGSGVPRGGRLYQLLAGDPEGQRHRAQLLLLEEQIHKLEGKYLSELAGDPSLLNGWKGYIQLTKQTKGEGGNNGKRQRNDEDERQFSHSSTTARAAMAQLQAGDVFAAHEWMPPAKYRRYLAKQRL
eukprot:EG_transcript_11452